ncbi:serine hydrolase [Bradyrhizobium sp. AUGA SZCCT0182]|uniref:serine hydrolase domain-containing protein n=1 Tax=Bradyrhizobium sp. AUGA SZCCT0182 TaxID=2807667 RepID=UPI001BACE6D5|nr:serine hydrolase [Bradyrhizobium sp. AUGA SZCCT0182]MBR1235688.1 serine hydrolase [Bradyrhizobium sp. AUGA SZCCT0182]
MKRTGLRLFTAVMLFGLAAGAAVRADSPAIVEHYPGAAFESTTPEAAGWSAEKLAEAKSWSQQIAPSAAVMIVQHGLVVAQWGDVAIKSNLHSIRKSLLSALIGIAVDEHKIDLGATMESLGIDDNTPGLTPTEKTATVGDLLKSRSGIYHAALYETPGMARRRPARGSHPPGTFWYYNNWDFNALGTIYERATGDSIFTALQGRIARPIGMQDYQPGDGEYFRGKPSEHPAYPIRMSARDLARFALLYLHEGRWSGRQIIPSAWVRESTQSYSDAFPDQGRGYGYGYLWWIGFPDNNGAPMVRVPAGTFAAMGAEGQYAFVIPAYDLVIVHRVNSDVPVGPLPGQRKPEPTTPQLARLLWLILSAAGDRDVGPDVSLAHAAGDRLAGEEIKAKLTGATFSVGEMLSGGPYLWQLRADGTLSILAGAEQRERFTGSWRVDGDRLCRTLNEPNTREACFSVVASGSRLQLFTADGLMRLDTRVQ